MLDSEHFFPLDGVLGCEGADSVMELACGSGVRGLRAVRGRAEGDTQGGVLDFGVGSGEEEEDRQVRGLGWRGVQERPEEAAGQEVRWARVDGGAKLEREAGVRRAGQVLGGEAAGRGRGRKAARVADGLAVGADSRILPTEGDEPPD